MKKKVFNIFYRGVKSFSSLNEIELVATFGSMLNFAVPDFDDLDVIIFSSIILHNKFIAHLKDEFKNNGFEIIVFKSIVKKPKKREKNQILIHDLSYRSLSDLVKKEWPSVVDSMKSEMVVIYGDKNYTETFPSLKISKKELFAPICRWSKKIDSEEDFKIFQKYLIKILPMLFKKYNHLSFNNPDGLFSALFKKTSWSKKLKELDKIITKI